MRLGHYNTGDLLVEVLARTELRPDANEPHAVELRQAIRRYVLATSGRAL